MLQFCHYISVELRNYCCTQLWLVSRAFVERIAVEHLSYLLTGIITTKKESSQEVFEIYVSRMFPQVFNVITYNTWIAVLVLVINSVSTLTLCFSDQLVIMGSIALGNYFQSFNDRMKIHKGKVYIYPYRGTYSYNLSLLLSNLFCFMFMVFIAYSIIFPTHR